MQAAVVCTSDADVCTSYEDRCTSDAAKRAKYAR